jgi:hypothetical protein
MALAVTINVQCVDSKNKASSTRIRVPTGFSIPQYIEAAQAILQLVANLQVGMITGATLTFSIDLSGLSLKTVANVLADVSQKGYFSFTSAVTGFFKRFAIPTFSEDLVAVGSDAIDTTDTDVAAFVAAMENGIVVTGGTISPTTERAHYLVALIDAREVFRRSR